MVSSLDQNSNKAPREELAEYQDFQKQLNDLQEYYAQARLTAWGEEAGEIEQLWQGLLQGWEDTLSWMTQQAEERFTQIGSAAEHVGAMISQSFTGVMENLAGNLNSLESSLEKLPGLAANVQMNPPNQGAGIWSELLSWPGEGWGGNIGEALSWFHQGGLVRAHQGMVISPSYQTAMSENLDEDERMVVTQTGEGILPRDSMARLGIDNFEALRRGQFEKIPPVGQGSTSQYHIQIQVQAWDADSIAGVNWERLVRRHLVPALEREERRRV
jgi:hypothetical protein